jgi:hypothetical protein
MHLGELRRFERLTRDAEGLQMAKRNAIAFNRPKDLDDERTDLLDRMSALPDPAEALARGQKMIDDLNRVDARQAEAARAN